MVKTNFVGFDYSEKIVRNGNDILKGEETSIAKRIEFVVGDAPHLPFKDESSDIIFTSRCLINIPKLSQQLITAKGIRRVFKKKIFQS